MGKITTLAFMLFGITFCLYLVGYQSAFLQLLSGIGGDPTSSSKVIDSVKTIFIGLLASSVITAVFTKGSTLAKSSLMMLLFCQFFLNFFIIPISYMQDAAVPYEISIFIFGVINLMLLLAFIEFFAERDI